MYRAYYGVEGMRDVRRPGQRPLREGDCDTRIFVAGRHRRTVRVYEGGTRLALYLSPTPLLTTVTRASGGGRHEWKTFRERHCQEDVLQLVGEFFGRQSRPNTAGILQRDVRRQAESGLGRVASGKVKSTMAFCAP